MPVAQSAAFVEVPRRGNFIGMTQMNEVIPTCKDFDKCVSGNRSSAEKCCSEHLAGSSRDCSLCAKSSCILRSDYCRFAGRPKDAYCDLCFDIADREEAEDASKRQTKNPSGASPSAPPSVSGKGIPASAEAPMGKSMPARRPPPNKRFGSDFPRPEM